MEMVNRPYRDAFLEWSEDKEKVVVLTADLTNSCEVGDWRDKYDKDNRYFAMGMAEQNMMSYAGGLAREGFYPWIHTFAVFIYRRPYDQMAMSIAYPNLPVRMMGFLPGITTPGGVTHQAIDDLAIMRATPNMTIISVADATETESFLDAVQAVNGPVYVRLIRGTVPRLFDKSQGFEFNRAKVCSDGDDVTIFSESICTEEVLRTTEVLKEKGIHVKHLHVSTIKPFTDPQIPEAIKESKTGVITVENHLVDGGLGTAVSELMSEQGIGKKLVKLGVQDTYMHGASKNYLMKAAGIDGMSIVKAVEKMVGKDLGITESMLKEARVEPIFSASKAEAL